MNRTFVAINNDVTIALVSCCRKGAPLVFQVELTLSDVAIPDVAIPYVAILDSCCS